MGNAVIKKGSRRNLMSKEHRNTEVTNWGGAADKIPAAPKLTMGWYLRG